LNKNKKLSRDKKNNHHEEKPTNKNLINKAKKISLKKMRTLIKLIMQCNNKNINSNSIKN
jgi:hypothetical protein